LFIFFSAFDASLSVKNAFNATVEVTDWFSLGIQLDIKPCTLKSIQCSGLSQDNCRQEMFDIWLRSDPNASWEVLIDALHKMKYHCLAQSVEQTYVNVYKAQNKQGTPTASECRLPSTVCNFVFFY